MREDFYYRINVVPIRIPPLRDRIEDVPLLVAEMLKNNPIARERTIARMSKKALEKLMAYHWPGNVRELGNVLERAVLKTSGTAVRDVDLPVVAATNGHAPQPGRIRDYDLPLKEFLRRAEREYLTAILRKNRGGISSTAEHAMIDAATLHRKMKTHSLRRDDFKERSSLRG
jgi:transcriptional regulator with PAS, ATPase and Fis domain